MQTDYWMPQSIDAEQFLLGNCLYAQIPTGMSDDDFYRDGHRAINRALRSLDDSGIGIDLVTVADWMDRNGVMDIAGGASYLATLLANGIDSPNFDAYRKMIKETANLRRLLQFCQNTASEIGSGKRRDLSEFASEIQQRVLEICEVKDESVRSLKSILKGLLPRIEERMASGGGMLGVPTGFSDLDRMTLGMCPGDLIVIAGRPGMGKTSLAWALSLNAARITGTESLFFSFEMPAEQLGNRSLSVESRIDLRKIRSASLSSQDYMKLCQAADKIYNLPIYVEDRLLNEIEIRHIARKRKPGLAVIDYLQYMTTAERQERKDLEIQTITRSLKGMAKELEMPVVLLSQLNRKVEERADKRPIMADLRESGAIEQDADVIMFVYRDEVYNENSPDRGTAEIIIGKQRNGPTGTVRLAYDGPSTAFRNLAREF